MAYPSQCYNPCWQHRRMGRSSGNSGISKIRGAIWLSRQLSPGLKCLPTYHPTAILRDWSLRPVTILDLAQEPEGETVYPEIRRPHRDIYIEPSLEDLTWYEKTFLIPAQRIAFDIETAVNQITCIGFAPDERSALVVPFADPRNGTGSYWPTPYFEARAWDFVRRVLASPQPKTAQTGRYDIHFLWRSYGITVNNLRGRHHAFASRPPTGSRRKGLKISWGRRSTPTRPRGEDDETEGGRQLSSRDE